MTCICERFCSNLGQISCISALFRRSLSNCETGLLQTSPSFLIWLNILGENVYCNNKIFIRLLILYLPQVMLLTASEFYR
jgi:hypothetical protein